ncbi:LpqB family beta-propeller domain-containing protein [Propionimicrobium sp. PCR01-08-3]|uniref:LpqB family beta-propeller domain-containing protein n=1 Tax=Propionimicrobium sp. PCR01-08-3 TaxID=3052086 RepID=UPI00255C6F0A|nr:LpqB family beta-propeller domain-containing protein [Propionimicrobium sp. PCR01-08-3]WIY83747.1 LpqB family beta-propeller domain-containing protein [Propionimicrobium sp. PCR01-08-3]
MRRRAVISLLVLLGVLCGCGNFPTSGPIETVGDTGSGDRTAGIDVAAQPPAPGASPDAILEGFFAACESPADGYGVARQYLTDEAAGEWRPETGIEVYDPAGHSQVITSDGSAVVKASLVGHLGADRVFTALHDEPYDHNFELTKVGDEWRISNPGDGILMSRQRFQQGFEGVPVYFWSSSGDRLVSQQVFLRQLDFGPTTPDGLVRAVIRGPGDWLRPSVLEVIPTDATSNGTWVDDDGIAHVSLSAEIEALSADQRFQAATQLLFTLAYFDQITGVQLNVGGNPLSINGADDDGVVHLGAVAKYDPQRATASRDLYVVQDGGVVRIPESDNAAAPVPVAGALGAGWDEGIASMAVSSSSDEIAVVNAAADRLYRASASDGQPEEIYHGSQLAKPQFDSAGTLWTLDNTAAGVAAVTITKAGEQAMIPIPELGSVSAVSFEISPDGARMAVVVQDGQATRLGWLRLRGSAGDLTIDGWRELPLNTAGGQIVALRQVVFVSGQRLMVLGATERDAQLAVYSFDADAALVSAQGPISDTGALALAAMPQGTGVSAAIVTADGFVLRYEAQYRWEELLSGATDVAFPG